MIHVLEQTQVVTASPERVWAYFATPVNLNDMTPPDLDFTIVRGATPVMRQGQLIEYRLYRLSSGYAHLIQILSPHERP